MDPNPQPQPSRPSSFNSLPVELHREILLHLHPGDKKAARLTCRRWEAVVNDLGRTSVTLNGDEPGGAELFQNSNIITFGQLTVTNMKERMPIYSSHRSALPGAKHLSLRSGNSPENVLALLRYYMKKSKGLSIGNNSFGRITQPFRLENTFAFDAITEFAFEVSFGRFQAAGNLSLARNEAELNHLYGLASFLTHARFPNLQRLNTTFMTSFEIEAQQPQQLPNQNQNHNHAQVQVQAVVRRGAFQALLASFGTFVARHKSTLEGFRLYWCGMENFSYPVTLQQIEACVNLKKLMLDLISMRAHMIPATFPTELTRVVTNLKKLKLISLSLDDVTGVADDEQDRNGVYDQAMNQLLGALMTRAEPESKVVAIQCVANDRLAWLQYPNARVQKLSLNQVSSFPPPPPQPTLPNLKKLTVEILPLNFEFDPENPDWRLTFGPWLIATAPNVEMIEILVQVYLPGPAYPNYEVTGHLQRLSLAHLQSMVNGLHRLTCLRIKLNLMYGEPTVADPVGLALVEGVEAVNEWLATFPPSQVLSWTLKLSRPLIPNPN